MNRIEKALKHIREPFYFVDLTDREREAVRLASRGKNVVNDIAPSMGVAPKTVYLDLHEALKKINYDCETNIKFQGLPDLLLRLIERSLVG